jgi:hypothetical protein
MSWERDGVSLDGLRDVGGISIETSMSGSELWYLNRDSARYTAMCHENLRLFLQRRPVNLVGCYQEIFLLPTSTVHANRSTSNPFSMSQGFAFGFGNDDGSDHDTDMAIETNIESNQDASSTLIVPQQCSFEELVSELESHSPYPTPWCRSEYHLNPICVLESSSSYAICIRTLWIPIYIPMSSTPRLTLSPPVAFRSPCHHIVRLPSSDLTQWSDAVTPSPRALRYPRAGYDGSGSVCFVDRIQPCSKTHCRAGRGLVHR